MDFEFWWLLAFPLFFGMGWLAARIDLKQLLSESRELPASYFKGLNFLLNEQQDKAIEAFIEVMKADTQIVELNFALGALFRRKGETERAIRLHRTLLDRADLQDEQRQMAAYELGQDYLKAGLLDRAEELFARLKDGRYARVSLKFLLEIYQIEKEWLKSIEIATQLAKITGDTHQVEIAEYYCELAHSEMLQSRPDAARRHLEDALAEYRKCIRANVLLGDLFLSQGQLEEAVERWCRIESQDPLFLALVGERIFSAYRQLGRSEEGLTLIRGYLAKYPTLGLLMTAYQAELELHDPSTAYAMLRDELRQHPSMVGLEKLLEAQVLQESMADRRQDLELIRHLVHAQTRRLALYCCDNCGFKAKQYYWHCPACGKWESYSPRRTEELERVELSGYL